MPTPKGTRGIESRNSVNPRLVSQLNCGPAVGMNPRRFLELLPLLGIPIARRGKLRLVQLDAFEAALMKLAETSTSDAAAIETDQPTTAAAVLARIGRRIGGAR
jgi:hypothetical protein